MVINKWSIVFNSKIDNQISKIHPKDIAFYHLPQLKSMANISENLKNTCNVCQDNMLRLDEICEELPDMMQGSISGRKKYELAFFNIEKHIMRHHGYRKPNYYLANGTFAGMIAGGMLGFIIGYFYFEGWILQPIIILSVLFLGAGRFWGYLRDKQQEKSKLII